LAAAQASNAELRSTSPQRREPVESAEPLDADRSRLHVTVSRRFLEKLEAAKEALSHAKPGASADEILEAGLDLLLAQHAKRKGLVEKPQKVVRPSKPNAIPAHVKRAVMRRSGGCCEWRLGSGERCGSKVRLEFDHIVPRARGGPPTVENIRMTCREHNQLAARLAFGDAWMDRFTRRRVPDGSAHAGAP
jgi:5-methylcytosine-specific restriction endonuclease McrA